MKIIKEYKRSIKFLCRKCGYPTVTKKGKGIRSFVSATCSPCLELTRHGKMDWRKWLKGMKKAGAA